MEVCHEDMNFMLDFSGGVESLSPDEEKEAKEGRVGGEDVEMSDRSAKPDVSSMTVEELVAKARAPIKKEFLTIAGVRVVNPHGVTGRSEKNDKTLISKRKLKKSRLEARKSATNICAVVAKTRDPSKCPYGDKCQFNHNLDVYMAQKPPDLPGNCPSLESGEPCSYSLTCRFAGTHKDFYVLESSKKKPSNVPANERNILRKDYQKLLWKNKGQYPKADAQLRAMGLMGKAFKLNTVDDEGPKGPDDQQVIVSSIPVTTVAEATVAEAIISGNNLDKTEQSLPGSTAKTHRTKRPKVITKGSAMDTNAEVDLNPDKNVQLEDTSFSQLLQEEGVNMPTAGKHHWRTLYLESKLNPREKKLIDFRDKLYLATLTTVGNLPFRRVCKSLGADITCGEMAMCRNLLQGASSEWALLRRHSSEDIFGVQICGGFPDHVARTAEMIERECEVDFIDINMGCPIDLVVNNGAGSCLLTKPQRLEQIVRATAGVMEHPLTVKLRMGYYEGRNCAHTFMPNLYEWGVSAVTIHGRTRQQRYSKLANWDYVADCVNAATDKLQVIGNGDIMAYTDWDEHLRTPGSKLSTCMIARGALMKPWIFTEIKESRHWDISSSERLDILRQYVNAGLAHWGSDAKGVEVTRKFLLEWLSYMHRYIPVGLLEVVPQRLNWRPPSYFGRNDLETMMASESAVDWIKISEFLLGPVPPNFIFQPKHKSNSYDQAENG
ncbi:tRNA-dihydrouridine synthase 3 [Marchantia polymorpha subsp. ruderalis]|uniref:tRNA-dihydrouridine(47) synthase [NAD(P)(+)] n=2 Tax=Marchantia polymorpha TaxID=3197 RepID=A0AAF6B323_MARPO|nr:hypothetical protein MARPO_0159s0020 [Marchantia polymorpha]BBN06407.1 hypothetical protein Mp_3g20900 [Marchantia polymorpha subsp. ruderalis]|eukprot:PTQ28605.1 hypothetical protein MARPO_0159s0020 [Marchantia polymorpha]